MELLRALGVMAEPPGPEAGRLAALLRLPGKPREADYTELFVFQLHPYASVYVGAEGQIGGDARDRVAGFWRALHVEVPKEPDHLAALLGLYAALADREKHERDEPRRQALRTARHALFWEHLASWLPVFLPRAEQLGSTTYAAWATLLRATLRDEAQGLGTPAALPRHLLEAPPLPGPDAGPDPWLEALLAPVRAGVILARADLARCARDLRLGLRAGERRFALRALLEQNPVATIGWLATEARRQAAGMGDRAAPDAAVTAWWADRASATADALDTLRTKETVDA